MSHTPPPVTVPDQLPVLDTDVSSPLGERHRQVVSTSRPQSSSVAGGGAVPRPITSAGGPGVSNSMASFGQSDTNDIVRVDDDEDEMMVGGGEEDMEGDTDPSSPTTSLELALSMAVERPSTAEVVVPGASARPGSSSSSPGAAGTTTHNNQSFSSSHHFGEGSGGSCDGFSTMIEVGVSSEQGARNTMEDRHLARLGDAKAAKNTGAGLLKSSIVSPPLASSSSSPNSPPPPAASPLPPSTAEKVADGDADKKEGTAVVEAKAVVEDSAASSEDSSGDDVGPDHIGTLAKNGDIPASAGVDENNTGTDAHRGASPKQGTTRGGGGGAALRAFHRAPSPATRRKRDQEQQQQREDEEEVSLRAEVEVMPEEELAQGIPFFAVYDGHGGTKCASYLRMKLAQFVLSHPKLVTDPEEAVSEGILAAEEEFLRLFGETDASGATAAVALFVGDSLVTANVGDTEIVLSRSGKAILLSSKHTPKDNPDEKQRVIDAGGRVVHGGRVGHPRFNPNVLHVALSRAMGDAPFKLPELTLSKPSGIIATPDTFTTPIHPEDEFVIIGCDGLWDVFTYQDAVDIGRKMLLDGKHTAQSISEALVQQAIQAGSSDNVTVLFLLYKQRPRSASHRPPSAIARRWQSTPPPTPTATPLSPHQE